MKKSKKIGKVLFILSLILFIGLIGILMLQEREAVYAESATVYEVRIVLPNGTVKWLGSAGLSSDSSTRLPQGSALSVTTIKQSYLQNGGLVEGKIFSKFKAQNDLFFTWTGNVVPNLDSFKNSDGVIILQAVYNNEYYLVDYYQDGEMIASVQLTIGESLLIPEITRVGYDIVGFTDVNNQTVYYGTTIWDLTPGTELQRSFISLEPIYNSVAMTIHLIGHTGTVEKQIYNVFYGDTLTDLIDGSSVIGKEFVGWFISQNLNAKEYKNGMIWDIAATADNQIVNLYSRYETINYVIEREDNLGTIYSPITYTYSDDPFYLDLPTKSGKTFFGWVSQYNEICGLIDPDEYLCNFSVYGEWIDDVVVNKNTSVNITSKNVALDFYNYLTVSFSTKTYNIKNSVENLFLKNTGTAGVTIDISFIIETRSSPLNIFMDSISFTSFSNNLFQAQDANSSSIKSINGVLCNEISGNTSLNLYVRGNSVLSGNPRLEYSINDLALPEKYHSAIVVADLGIFGQTSSAELTIKGGIGMPMYYDSNAGELVDMIPGGCAIWAHNMLIDIPTLNVFGGNGGGYSNIIKGKPPKAANGNSNYYHGTNGTKGGTGGSGRYALNVSRSIEIIRGSVTCTGGDGGNGGEGGDGGNGFNAPAFWNGGDGGNGGEGGDGGLGFDAIMRAATITGNLIQIKGKNGTGGEGGAGGEAGKGGLFAKNGTKGSKGANGKTPS